MFEKLPFKKEYVVVAATAILLLIGYQLALKKTITAWHLNHQLQQQLARSTDLSIQPQYQERKNANLTKIISRYQADTSVFRSRTLSDISLIAGKENVKLTEVPVKDPLYHTPQTAVQRLEFEGDYFALLKALNRLQHTDSIGVVRSVTFRTAVVSPGNEKTKKLTLEVYLEILNN